MWSWFKKKDKVIENKDLVPEPDFSLLINYYKSHNHLVSFINSVKMSQDEFIQHFPTILINLLTNNLVLRNIYEAVQEKYGKDVAIRIAVITEQYLNKIESEKALTSFNIMNEILEKPAMIPSETWGEQNAS